MKNQKIIDCVKVLSAKICDIKYTRNWKYLKAQNLEYF